MYTGMQEHTTLVSPKATSALYEYQTGMNLRLHQPNIRFIPTLYGAKISLEPNTSPIPGPDQYESVNIDPIPVPSWYENTQYQYLTGYERGHTSTTLV
jgi:hypothetical protein